MDETSGEVVGINEGVGEKLPAADGEGNSVGVGKAKVGAISGAGEPDALSLGDGATLGEGDGVGVAVGVGVGVEMRFCHRYSGTLAPPISCTSFSQRARIFSRLGGPNGVSAVPGKIK